jgi:hypothetical protein
MGADAQIAVLTSMNLNKNPRFEYLHCTWDPAVVALLAGIAEEIWRCPELAEAAAMRPQEHGNIFGGLGPANAPRAAGGGDAGELAAELEGMDLGDFSEDLDFNL